MFASSAEARFLALAARRELARRQTARPLTAYYPATGPLRRELYPKHLAFFRAGASHRLRLVIGANKIGKTEGIGGYEMALHLTGRYPAWWEGARFTHPIRAWAVGETTQTTRDIVQQRLLGPVDALGTGLLPKETVLATARKSGSVPEAIELARIQHVSGGVSRLVFKSYDQQRTAFQGDLQHCIWLDEEPPLSIHSECHLRIMPSTTFAGGVMMLTFTPLQGLSETVLDYLPEGQLPEGEQRGAKYVQNITWDDVPHLSDADKAEFLSTIPAYQRDARTRGIPVLGAGVIYPVEESAYLVEPFELPPHWHRAYALDVGWQRTAAVWGAYDPEQDTWSLYHEHYRGEAEPSIHAAACKAPGAWIRGVIDPAARGRSQDDGAALLDTYRQLGLDLTPAVNAVEAGIYQMLERLTQSRLKVFSTLTNWRKEVRLYRRDEKGRIVKTADHLMDATRYLLLSGRDVARAVPVQRETARHVQVPVGPGRRGGGWRNTFKG
jgi:phage terminase large subunit-like protein